MGLLVIGGLALAGCGPPKVPPNTSLHAFTTHIDDNTPARLESYAIPGAAIGLVEDGELVWTGAYGYADRQADRPATPETLYRVGSISKYVVAWGIMHLVEIGALRLDDPVEEHLRGAIPSTEGSFEGVTVRRLLSHSAGLPRSLLPSVPPDDSGASLETLLSEEVETTVFRPVETPGKGFRYSNGGYALLELLIEEVTERDFASYMRETVLRPLGMRRATFKDGGDVQTEKATGYDVDGTPVPAFVDVAKAPGALFATVNDMGRFLEAGLSTKEDDSARTSVLSPASIRTLYQPVIETEGIFGLISDAYGLGHFLENRPTGPQGVYHGGQHTGWIAHFYGVPETRSGIVILTNSERSLPFVAETLGVWGHWQGLSSVRMSSVFSWVSTGGWGLLGLVLTLAFAGIAATGRDLFVGRRRLAPSAKPSRRWRLVQGSAGLLLIIGSVWGLNQEVVKVYLPVLSGWLGSAVILLALIVLLRALCPRTPASERREERGNGAVGVR